MSFPEAVATVKKAMGEEGFGILTEIDVKATLQKKLGVEYDNYVILGVCNPPFAYKALQSEKEVWLLLPCNVIVYEENGEVAVSAILPTVAMSMMENQDLREIAREAERKLKRAIDTI